MKLKWRNILFIAGMFLLVVLLMDFSHRVNELERLSRQLEAMQQQGTQVMETPVAYSSSEQAVHDWVYQEGKWVRPGETLVEIVPMGEPTAPPAPEISPAEAQPNWKIWWDLFFGERP